MVALPYRLACVSYQFPLWFRNYVILVEFQQSMKIVLPGRCCHRVIGGHVWVMTTLTFKLQCLQWSSFFFSTDIMCRNLEILRKKWLIQGRRQRTNPMTEWTIWIKYSMWLVDVINWFLVSYSELKLY